MGHIGQINERASNPLRAKLHAAAAVTAAAAAGNTTGKTLAKRHAGGTTVVLILRTSIRVALRGTPYLGR